MPAYREDILTPKERFDAFLTGAPMDRMLCMPLVTSYAAKIAGRTIKEYQQSGKTMAECHVVAYDKLRYDLIYLFTNCSYVAEAMGQPLEYPDDEPASCPDPIIKSEADLAKIRVAGADDGLFPVYYEAIDILKEKLGDQVYMTVCFSGPLSTAATLRDVELFVKDTYKAPEFCHKLLRMCTDSCKNFIAKLVAKGVIPVILEPISSGSILSPKMYDAFSAPYSKELVDYTHGLGSPVALHICGKTNKIIGKMADSGANIISFDICDLAIAKEKVAGRAVLLGNVTPADVLYMGPKEDVKKVCEDALEFMKDYKPGFILATGCELPKKIPYEHLEAMMEVIRTTGVLPYAK
ncbi:MAG: uroporphyrinogen decarboxylase family protein [Acidobacteriota bacterium]|jgi:uroporphyrinogen decarboxylase|nr:uroporphyrinogen decarboxylase family protein [Acidobacteriota bacterium]